MKNYSPVLAVVACFFLASCASSDPMNFQFSDHAKDALVLIAAEPSSAPYIIHLTRYDEVNQTIEQGSFGQNDYGLEVLPSNSTSYIFKTLPPGRYVFSSMFQQLHWGVCFYKETRSFNASPSQAVFLGDFRPKLHLGQIESFAAESGQVSMSIGILMYFDDILPPQITTPTVDSVDFLLAKKYEATSIPSLHGRLEPVEYKPAKFSVGVAWDGQHVCLSHPNG